MKGKGEGGNVIGVKTGESGGSAGGRGGGRSLGGGGGVGGGRSANSGRVLRWSATPHGFSHKSIVVSVVGLAGQSKRWETDCVSKTQDGQSSSADFPIRN